MKYTLPVMLLKGLVLLPTQEVRLELNNDSSTKVINLSTNKYNDQLLIICPKDQYEESPEVSDLPSIGVVGKIKSKIELPNGNFRVVISGFKRVKILNYFNNKHIKSILQADVMELDFPKFDVIEETALRRKLIEVLEKYINASPYVSNSILSNIREVHDLYRLTDIITSFIPFSIDKKMLYMEEINALHRANALIYDLNIELQVVELDEKLDEALRNDFEQNQKEIILREKIESIKKELGEENAKDEIISKYLEVISELDISSNTRDKLLKEVKKLEYTNESSPEMSMIRSYLDLVISLPWGVISKDNNDLDAIKKYLDSTHYGLDKIKDRIVEYIAVKKRNKNLKSPIICLVGPPGVGKTSLAMGIAKSLNKEFYKISVGGLNDGGELVGHRRTYIGSNTGKIIQAIKKCNTSNPLILIDEVDKMVKDYKGDPAAVLLDILDPEQNKMFIDNYVEEPFDLSNVMFILTANSFDTIPEALIDRLEVIELSSYTEFEKIDIAKKYLLPKIFEEHMLKNSLIKFDDDIIRMIINKYTKEAGVRELQRQLSTIVRKIVTESVKKKIDVKKIVIKKSDLDKYLGPIKYDLVEANYTLVPGLVNGLAYTAYGGMMMPVEAVMYPSKDSYMITGMIGQSMDESVKVAISYIKSKAKEFKIDNKVFDDNLIHIHFLDGAIKKDGPSAGVTIVTAIISLLLNKVVEKNYAMTGEITLRGDILKIGGLKEKIIGAYNKDVNKIFIPIANLADLDDIPTQILNTIEIIPVSNYIEIFNYLFKKLD
ncbi:MAG: endopeptidase La [Bacilli bacterium]